MANIKTSPAEWEKAQRYFEAGLLLREIEDKTGISIPRLSKKAKADGWAKANEKQQLIADEVRVRVAKANLDDGSIAVHNEIVDKKVQRLEWLNTAALKNVQEAMQNPCADQQDFRHRANTIKHAVEVIDPPKTGMAVQINNSNQVAGGSARELIESRLARLPDHA